MKKLINDPTQFVDEMLEGLLLAHPDARQRVGEDREPARGAHHRDRRHDRGVLLLDVVPPVGTQEVGEGGLGSDSFGVVAGGDQQQRSGVDADAA